MSMDDLATRPARVQVDASELAEPVPDQQVGRVFNIWHRKWAGGDRDPALSRRKSPFRCDIAKDAGYTQADKHAGGFFCLYFARGMCFKGARCTYLHRLPTAMDSFVPSVDCFGREKFANFRDDMAGVGSFLHQNRTLYVARVHHTADAERLVRRNFGEWGAIEKLKFSDDRSIAFVTFKNEANAQFAKEAMAHQTMGGSKEILTVKWATNDPNPRAAAKDREQAHEVVVQAIKSILQSGEPSAHASSLGIEASNVAANNDTRPEQMPKRSKRALVSQEALDKLKKPRPLVDYSDSE